MSFSSSDIQHQGRVINLVSNLDRNNSNESYIVKVVARVPHEDFMALDKALGDYGQHWKRAIDDMLKMVNKNKINPNDAEPRFETPVKRKQTKREAPSSSSVNKIVLLRSKRQANEKTSNQIDNQENDTNLINQPDPAFVAKESSIDVPSNFNQTTIRTRAQTRFLKKQKELAEQSLAKLQNSTKLNNQSSSNLIASSKKCVTTDLFNTPLKSSNRMFSSSKNQNKQNEHSSKKNAPSIASGTIMSTPTTCRRPDDILKTSVEKVKKAEANRKAFLESKQHTLRERSAERKNRVLANQKKRNEIMMKQKQLFGHLFQASGQKLKPPPIIHTPPEKKARHNERLKKLQDLNVEKIVRQNKPKNIAESKMNSTTTIRENDLTNGLDDKVKNLNLNDNEFMTADESNIQTHIAKHPSLSPIMSDDIQQKQQEPNITFTAISKTPINKTIVKMKDEACTSYEMTPPSRPTVINYDISALVDSDDEEEQILANKRSQAKPIPQWACGKEFTNAIRRQFESAEELNRLVATIFVRPRLPVDLDAMGMKVHPRYQERTSSICWDKFDQHINFEKKNNKSIMISEDEGDNLTD